MVKPLSPRLQCLPLESTLFFSIMITPKNRAIRMLTWLSWSLALGLQGPFAAKICFFNQVNWSKFPTVWNTKCRYCRGPLGGDLQGSIGISSRVAHQVSSICMRICHSFVHLVLFFHQKTWPHSYADLQLIHTIVSIWQILAKFQWSSYGVCRMTHL